MKEKIEKLTQLLLSYQKAYYTTGMALVSDAEYDRLYDSLVRLESQYPQYKSPVSPTLRVGSDLSSDFPEVPHTIPVLSLDKAYSSQEILSFINTTSKVDNLSYVLEEKIDGFSIVLYYRDGRLERAVTRGNGHIGNDVTQNVMTIHAVPLELNEKVTIAVRGEIYLPKKDFEKINAQMEIPYANPRNLAAGTIRRNRSSETAKVPLSIFCYEGFEENSRCTDHMQILKRLRDLGLRTNDHITCFTQNASEGTLSFSEIGDEIRRRTEQRKSLDYEIDGLVLKVNELSKRDELGFTEHHPRWAIAYKFESPVAKSTVLSIDVQVGRTGRLTPMARIKPTELSGSTISNVTLHNQDYVDSLEIAVGDTVEISKRGDVIPAVEQVLEKNDDDNRTYVIPDTCPVCNAPVRREGSHHYCQNPSCPAKEKGLLEFFCARKQMDIEGLGPRTLEILYDNGYIRSIPDLYRFDYDALIRDRIEGFGEKKVSQIREGLEASKKKDFRTLVASLGFAEVGHKSIDLICDAFSVTDLDDLREVCRDTQRLETVNGLGKITSKAISDAFESPLLNSLLDQLVSLGLGCGKEEKKDSSLKQIFEGQSWCITGTFEHFVPRERAGEEITARGGRLVSSVSSKTDCLLCGENAGSKLAKAQSLGVRVVNEKEFLALIGDSKESERPEEQPLLWT